MLGVDYSCLLVYKGVGEYRSDSVRCRTNQRLFFMEQPYEEIHIGNAIKHEMHKQGRKNTWLAEQINCDASNISKIYNRKSIDCELLKQISKALGVNFFEHYYNETKTDK